MLRGNNGQSVVEFALVLPALLVLGLGAAQLFIICANSMMLQYAAYMAARTACMHSEESMLEETKKTLAAAGNMMFAASNFAGFKAPDLKSAVMHLTGVTGIGEFTVSEINISGGGAAYRRVTVNYSMPLKVPLANRIFVLFIMGQGIAGTPVINLTACALARVE